MIIEQILICILFVVVLLLYKKNSDKNLKNENKIETVKKDTVSLMEKSSAELTQKFESQIDELIKGIAELESENQQLRSDLEELNKKLNFYANIQEASGELMVGEDEKLRNSLLEKAKSQILDDKGAEATSLLDVVTEREKEEAVNEDSVLDAEQEKARFYMETSEENMFITGRAGTGKSFLLDAFVATTKKRNVVLAPTGIAALNVGGATLHSTFGYHNLVNLDVDDISKSTIRLKSEKKLVLKNINTIIIDEISMVRADTFDKIDRILKVLNGNDTPFGGKQILVFGDLFQLPPIAKREEYDYLMERYGGIHFYHSNAYKEGNFKFAELTINHRQTNDKLFFEMLNRVRVGRCTSEDLAVMNNRVSSNESIYDRFTTLFPTKEQAERVNHSQLQALKSKEYMYKAEVVFEKHPERTRMIESIFPITDTLKLKVGALVMMVANDTEHRWVNGTMGIVERLSDDTIYVSINKHTYEIHKYEFIEQEVNYENGKIKYEPVFAVSQYPIVLAYAITIHKSQGQTYKNIVCDINNCFANGQAYVALSRCASLEGLHLKGFMTKDSIKVDNNILEFYLSQSANNLLQTAK